MRENRTAMGWRILLVALLCATAGVSPTLGADDPNRPLSPSPSAAPQELLLVRAWNPDTGQLIGSMPLHRGTLTLQRLPEVEELRASNWMRF
jgi:hypothetical protein